MTATATKGQLGAQDLHLPDGTTNRTFSRRTSTEGVATLNDATYEIDALVSYGGGVNYTQATIEAALIAIGTVNKVTLLLRPGTWVISSNADWSAYTNVTFRIVPGAVISHGAFTLNIPNANWGRYQVFSGTGAVTLSGTWDAAFPEWWGAKADGTTNSTDALNYTAVASKKVSLAAGTYMTDGFVVNGGGNVWTGAGDFSVATWASNPQGGTIIKARGVQDYVMSTISRFSLFEHITFDGSWSTTTVVRIYVPSLKVQFKHCTFMATLDDTGLGGTSNGKLVWDDSTSGGTVGTTQGDSMLFEDCNFTTGDPAGLKLTAISLKFTGSNAILNNVNRCYFNYSRISIDFAGGAGGRVINTEFEGDTLANIQYTGSGGSLRIENNYSEDSVSFLRMTEQVAVSGVPILVKNNTSSGSMLLYLGQPITLEGNSISQSISLLPPGALTPYYPVLSIRNNLAIGFTGADVARVIRIADGITAEQMPLALEIGAKGSVGTVTLTINSATSVVPAGGINATGTSYILLTPVTASAAADQGSATGVWVSGQVGGTSFTLTHPNSAVADRIFKYVIMN